MMLTKTRVNSNLWRKAQSGLLGVNRRNFPIDGLELYLPLWHPELSGTPIVSKDLNAYSCTVTGSVHSPNVGRVFDGDDYIRVPDNAALSGLTKASWVSWYNSTTATSDTLFSQYGANGTRAFLFYVPNDSKLRLITNVDGSSDVVYTSDDAFVSANTWYCFAATFDGSATTVVLYSNGVAKAGAGTVSASLYDSSEDIGIGGAVLDGVLGNPMNGTIGESWMYSRVLSATEITHIYNSTKRRYL